MKSFCSFLVGLVILCSAQRLSAATVTNLNDSGPGSLRAALAADGNIEFTVTGTILLTSGQLEVNRSVTITGPGAEHLTIARSSADGTPEFRVFLVRGAPVTISGLTIQNGLVGQTHDTGAGLRNEGTLTLNDCVVRGNRSTGSSARGTGLFNANEATLTANRCVFANNVSDGEGSGIYVFGVANLNDSTISGNRGEGFYSRGGGLHVDYFGRAGVSRCTFSSNSVTGGNAQGGGIYNYGRLEIVNSTVSDNHSGETGGGIHADALAPNTAIRNCTISGNTAATGAGLCNFGMSGNTSTRSVKDSIIAGNAPGDIENAGVITSSGYNLFGLISGNSITPGTGDHFGVTAAALKLAALASNGGPTRTRALLAGSPAINAGNPTSFPATDQRGVPRPFGSRPDIGAFELDIILPPLVTVFATRSNTLEMGPTVDPVPGKFTISRSGNTNESLQVFYRLSGTASNGLDYHFLPNSVTIPAGRASTELLVLGLFDGLVEGTETVVLRLEEVACLPVYPPPPGCYTIGAPVEAVVAIQDYDHPTNQPPTINLVSPANGFTSTAPAIILLIAKVNDPDGVAANATVEFFSGTNKIGHGELIDPGPLHEAHFRFFWTNVPAGEYTLTARGKDEKDATAASDPRHVIVRGYQPPNHPPAVQMTSPMPGQFFSAPAEIQLVAYAEDFEDGNVLTVEFFAGDHSLGFGNFVPSLCPSFCPNYMLTWSNVPPGQYTLTARATDSNATATVSAPVPIVVYDSALSLVTISATDASATEAGDSGTFTVSREGNTNSTLHVYYSIGGTAANGVDYFALSNSVLLAEGVKTTSIQITPIEDVLFEGPERVEIRLLPPPFYLFPYLVGTPSNAVVNITDNDEPLPNPVVTIEATDPAASETPGNPGQFRIRRSGPTNETLQLYWALTGSASNGLDYVRWTNKVFIPAGQSVVEFLITPINDILVEGTESVVATLYYPLVPGPGVFPYIIGTPSNAVVTIADNDEQAPKPVVTIEATDATASETPGNPGQFKIRRTGSTNQALYLSLAISGTASNGVDYVRVTNLVVLLAGRTVAELPVLPIDDNLFEGTETVIATLYYPPIPGPLPLPYTIGSPSNATVTILDNDPRLTNLPPVVRIYTPTNEATFTAPANILICTTPGDGDDYVATVEFFAGDTSLGIQTNTCIPPHCIPILPWTFCLTWSNVPPGNYTLTAKATDNHGASSVSAPVHVSVFQPPKPVVTIHATDATASETVGNPGQFRIQRTGPTNESLQLSWALAGSASNGVDFVRLTNKVVIPAGQSAVEYVITPIDDTLVEGTESVVATLYYPLIAGPGVFPFVIGTPSNAVVSIADNDEPAPKPVVTIEAPHPDASETPGHPGLIHINRTGPTNHALTVYCRFSGTASNGVDYASLTNPVVIPAGNSFVRVAVVPVDDNQFELSETVVATLFVPQINTGLPYNIGSPSNAIVTILDNDLTVPPPVERATVTIEATDPQARETGLLTVVEAGLFTLRRTGNTNPALLVQFAIEGTAINGMDYLALSNRVLIPSGATAVQIPIYPLNDNLAEGTETVRLTVQPPMCVMIYPPPPECYVVGTNASATVFISDPGTPELPVVTITASDPIASEGTNCFRWVGWSNPPPVNFCGTNTATFVVRRTGSINASLTIAYEIGGTASNGTDYLALPGHVTIPAGSRTAEIRVLPVDDAARERIETVVLALTAPPVGPNTLAPYLIGIPRRAGAVIADNDQPRPTTGPLTDRGFHLMRPGTNGTWFRIECSTNLIHWTALGTNVVTDGAIHFVDPDAATSPSRFYRAVAEPNPQDRPVSIGGQAWE